ncbi:hypothetical protein D3C76_614380 [compost metagenome]
MTLTFATAARLTISDAELTAEMVIAVKAVMPVAIPVPMAVPTAFALFSTSLRHFAELRSALSMPATKPPTCAMTSRVKVPNDLEAIFFSGQKKARRAGALSIVCLSTE